MMKMKMEKKTYDGGEPGQVLELIKVSKITKHGIVLHTKR